MNRRHSKSMGLLLAFLSLMLTWVSVRTDRALVPLGELINRSDRIIIGVVTDVAGGKKPGEQIASIRVEEVLRGAKLPKLSLRGSSTDPSVPEFYKGTRILAFLRAKQKTDSFEPVYGDHGVIAVGDEAIDVTRDIVKKAIKKGKKIRLRDVRYCFQRETPAPPRVLVGSLLGELTLRVTPKEAPLLQEMACDTLGLFYMVPQVWAISRVGALKLSEARPCLESFVREGKDRDISTAAIEALGDLGDPKSVSVLRSLLPRARPEPGLKEDAERNENDAGKGDLQKDEDGDTRPTGPEDPEEETRQVENEDDPSFELEEGSLSQKDAPPDDTSRVEEEPDSDDDFGMEEEPIGEGRLRRADTGVTDAVLLALGKIGAPEAIPVLLRVIQEEDDLALHSTVVHALGLIGTPEVEEPLTVISKTHPNELIRGQAERTLERLRGQLKKK